MKACRLCGLCRCRLICVVLVMTWCAWLAHCSVTVSVSCGRTRRSPRLPAATATAAADAGRARAPLDARSTYRGACVTSSPTHAVLLSPLQDMECRSTACSSSSRRLVATLSRPYQKLASRSPVYTSCVIQEQIQDLLVGVCLWVRAARPSKAGASLEGPENAPEKVLKSIL